MSELSEDTTNFHINIANLSISLTNQGSFRHDSDKISSHKAIINLAKKASLPLKSEAQFLAQTKESAVDLLGRNEHLRSFLKQLGQL